MKRCRKPNSTRICTTSGMTLIEVVLILLVLGILAATVAVHVSSGTADLTVAADGISSRLRLVQSLAMNNSQAFWGIQFDSDNQRYRVFRCNGSDCDTDSDDNAVSIPGTNTDVNGWITLSDSDIQFKCKNTNKESVAFNSYGKPYEIKKSSGASPLQNQSFTLTLEDGAGNNREIQVTPKTGFVP